MRIAKLDDYQGVALSSADWSGIRAHGEIDVFHDTLTDGDPLRTRLAPYDVLCVMRERTPITADLIAALPNLKLIVTTGKRNDAVDVAAATSRGITVCGTESPSTATPELTFALILGLARGIVPENKSMRDGGWQVGLGRDLAGSTLGVVGLGRLGAKVATIAQAFGMHVTAWSTNLTPKRCAELGVEFRPTKQALLADADFVTIHQRLSDRTRGMFGATEFSQMKSSAYLINTSRGPIIDDTALIVAVNQGVIAGAGLDVYDQEPLAADHPLRRCDRLLLTPHLGYVTQNTWNVFYRQTVEAVQAWINGAPIRVIS
ncbi:D-2-hydroxyacid dehydrogenase family protein [Thalassospira sp. MA62]|nr:D-2-hydroxyacid dehydrogenase family protein [Thalassospira sp. MA62]